MAKKILYLRLSETVDEIEQQTAADLVVVLRSVSGVYRDLSLAAGALAGFLWLTFVVYAPASFDEVGWPWEVALVFFVVWQSADRLPLRFLPWFKSRQNQQVDSAARVAFIDHKIDQTRRHLGILIYASKREGQARILVDRGAPAQLSVGRLGPFERQIGQAWASGSLDELDRALRHFGKHLAEILPRDGQSHELGDTVDAGPNA